MRRLILIACACACGGRGAGRRPMLVDREPPPPVVVEWKVEQGEGDHVDVSLVVEGTAIPVGPLYAATEHEAGTPATCALRAASPRRTEIVCGDTSGYLAELGEGELVISHLAGPQKTVVRRVPVGGDSLAVKMLALPLGP